jgi:hypothetical protein
MPAQVNKFPEPDEVTPVDTWFSLRDQGDAGGNNLAEHRIHRKQIPGGLAHEYYVAA